MDKVESTAPVPRLFRHKTGFGPVSAVLITLLAYFGSQLIAGIGVALYAHSRGYSEQQISDLVQNSVIWQFWFVLAVEAVTLLILFWFMKLRHIKLSEIGLGRIPKWSDLGNGVITFGLYFIALLAVMGIISKLIPSINIEQQQQIGFESASGFSSLALVFISLVVLPPIVEEITVRGFLFSGLNKKLGVVASALIASLLFAAAHLQLGSGEPQLWVAAIDTFLLSIVLIVLRVRTGALWAGMLVHALKNGIAFAYLFVF